MATDPIIGLNARDDMLYVVAHWNALRAQLRPGGGNAQTGVVSTSGEKPLPIDVHVSDLLREIEDLARFYGQILLEEVPPVHGCGGTCHGAPEHACDGYLCADDEPVVPATECYEREYAVTVSTMPGLLDNVARRYGHFTEGDERMALDFCDDAHTMREKVRKAVERPEAPTYVGPCRTKGVDGSGCSGELYVGEGRIAGTCRTCGTEFTIADQRAYLQSELATRLMTPAEIVRALKTVGHEVQPGTLFKWVQREKILPVEEGLFLFSDALDYVAARKGRVA